MNIPVDYAKLSKSEQQELQHVFEKLTEEDGMSEEDALEEVLRSYRSSCTTRVCDKVEGGSYAGLELPLELWGGKLGADDIQQFLSASYSKNPPQQIANFIQDPTLTGQRVQVYCDPSTGQAVVVHRGTQGIHDWGNSLKYALGFDMINTKRFSHALKIQKAAEQKYGAKNICTLGHSLGANIASQVSDDSGEIIAFDKPLVNVKSLEKDVSKDIEMRSRPKALAPIACGGEIDLGMST